MYLEDDLYLVVYAVVNCYARLKRVIPRRGLRTFRALKCSSLGQLLTNQPSAKFLNVRPAQTLAPKNRPSV